MKKHVLAALAEGAGIQAPHKEQEQALKWGSREGASSEGGVRAAGSRILAISRVIGISCGVLLVELGSVLIFPKSATEASLEEMGATLHKLCEMNRVAWGHGPLYQPEWLAAWKREAEK